MPEIIRLPQDTRGFPIPILGVLEAGSHGVAYTGTSARTGADFSPMTEIVTLFATSAAWVRFGNNTVAAVKPAASHDGSDTFFLPANVLVDVKVVPKGSTRVAAIQDTAGGTLYVWERA